jgi:chromosomal replication initiation ATPase DnaA
MEKPMRSIEQRTGIWRLSLEQIEATVADHLGNGRVLGNQFAPCLSRQVSMYLAKNVVGWSTTKIGRFYNGRHHTTVLHAIVKIELAILFGRRVSCEVHFQRRRAWPQKQR